MNDPQPLAMPLKPVNDGFVGELNQGEDRATVDAQLPPGGGSEEDGRARANEPKR